MLHLVLGGAGLRCPSRLPAARVYGWVLAVVGGDEQVEDRRIERDTRGRHGRRS